MHVALECLLHRSHRLEAASLLLVTSTPVRVLGAVLGLCVLIALVGLTMCLGFWMHVRMIQLVMG
jgi:hypothetical protein